MRELERDPDSLLWWIRQLVMCYRACPELAWGAYTVLDPGPEDRPVLAHRCDADGAAPVTLHNLADVEIEAAPVLPGLAGRDLTDVLDPRADPVRVAEDGTAIAVLPPYGCRWLRSAA